MDDSVERLHRALVSAIERTRDGDLERPVTVSEIYQQLMPYRAARAAVGFDMNADYEYALLRLLAGEGNYARLEPGEVRETLRSELESPNPNVSLFREYANCDVWVSAPPKWVSEMVAEKPAPRFQVADDDEMEDEMVADELLLEDSVEDEEPPPTPQPVVIAPVAPTQECAFCGGDLPAGRLANFCPHCGRDLSQRVCPGCGEVLDPAWRFCANCGTQAATYDAEAN